MYVWLVTLVPNSKGLSYLSTIKVAVLVVCGVCVLPHALLSLHTLAPKSEEQAAVLCKLTGHLQAG